MRTQVLVLDSGRYGTVTQKNFSIFIDKGDQYRLHPSLRYFIRVPTVNKKSLHEKDLKLAMSLKGSRGRKYECRIISRRHFLATANEVGFSGEAMNKILDDMAARTEQVIEDVATKLPHSFPTFISEPIFEGMRKYSQRLVT